MLTLDKIDSSWTLFLDRDGVINEEKPEQYILNWNAFKFYEGVSGVFEKLSERFGTIVIVTNQKGVGKGLMSQQDLNLIHANMKLAIENAGGRIDGIYACTDLDNLSFNRKPQPGMAFQAQNQYPQIDFKKSIMAGNKPGDMSFARAAGMYSVFIATTNPEVAFPHPDIDLRFDSLLHFTNAL